ncbi:Chromosome partition protein MukB, partial [Haemophilus influenzae]
VLRFVKNVKI